MPIRQRGISSDVIDAKRRIAESVLTEVRKHGVLGLRIAAVAKGSEASEALIHKYFGNRDGLVAEVIGDAVENNFLSYLGGIIVIAEQQTDENVVDTLLDLMAKPDDEWRYEHRWLRLEAKAAGVKIPALRLRMENVITNFQNSMTDMIVVAREKYENKSQIPAATIAWLLISIYDGITNIDLSTEKVTNEDYLKLVRNILVTHVFREQKDGVI